MGARIVDNDRLSLSSVLRELAPAYKDISIATGYWDLAGYKELLSELSEYESVRILIGQEPLAPRHAAQLNIFAPDADFPEKEFAEALENEEFSEEVRETLIEIKRMIASGRMQVRVFRGEFLHAKAYIFGTEATSNAVGIIGSSNFTGAGLTRNRELNSVETDSRVVRYRPESLGDEHGHISWFNEIWNSDLAEDWTGRFKEVLELSPVGDVTFSAYEMYIRALYELFEDEIVAEVNEDVSSSDVLFEFQKRNANLLLKKLQRYGLAMLADSVGLGKTITAGEVIRHYLRDLGARRIYVVAPANLLKQWRADLERVHGLFHGYHLISMQDIGRIQQERQIDEYAGVDLFVVDEAHNLRSGSGARHDEILDWFSDNPDSDVLLLTATPINNSLKDFVNQIQLAAKGRLESFPVVYPTATKTETLDFFRAVERLTAEANKAEKKGEKPDYEKARNIMRQGLSRYLVRTTRQGIEREFGGVLGRDGRIQRFPKTKVKPEAYSFSARIVEKISDELHKAGPELEGVDPTLLSTEKLLDQTQRTKHPMDQFGPELLTSDEDQSPFGVIFNLLLLLGFAPYKTEVYRHQYYGKEPEEISAFGKLSETDSLRLSSELTIHNMLRVVLLKRLESSHFALKRSLQHYLQRLIDFEFALDSGYIIKLGDLRKIKQEFGEDVDFVELDDLMDHFEDVRVEADPSVFDLNAMKKDLSRDKSLVNLLVSLCEALEEDDDKLRALADLIDEVRKSESGKKVLVFSYFADTINYLKSSIDRIIREPELRSRVGFTTGANRKELESLARRFSPISKDAREVTSEEEIDFLFSTDVLSEGQNLQDCAVLVNFDLHWNPVRMIQRNGRINRLGSRHDLVQIFNMHPDVNLEEYLALVQRLETKIERIANTVGTDASVLGEAENPIEYISDLYDEAHASEAFANFDDDQAFLSQDEYIFDLREFEKVASEAEKQRVKSIPAGKWGYFPQDGLQIPSDIRALSLIRVSGGLEDSRDKFLAHVFVSTTETTQPVETIKALQMIRAERGSETSKDDRIQIDRELVKTRGVKIAQKHASTRPSFFRITASPGRVLDKLVEVRPDLHVRAQLEKVSKKNELREVKGLFSVAARELRNLGSLSSQTIQGFSDFVDAMAEKTVELRAPDHATGVLHFGK